MPSHSLVYPLLAVLPMGFSWSVFWTQTAHRELLRRSGLAAAGVAEIIDRRVPPVLEEGDVGRVVYIDNQLFLSAAPHGASQARRRAHGFLTKLGLPLHEIQDDVSTIDFIGLELDGLKQTVRASGMRRWRVRQGTQALLRRKLVTGQQVEVLLGHWVQLMLCNRQSLRFQKCLPVCAALLPAASSFMAVSTVGVSVGTGHSTSAGLQAVHSCL